MHGSAREHARSTQSTRTVPAYLPTRLSCHRHHYVPVLLQLERYAKKLDIYDPTTATRQGPW